MRGEYSFSPSHVCASTIVLLDWISSNYYEPLHGFRELKKEIYRYPKKLVKLYRHLKRPVEHWEDFFTTLSKSSHVTKTLYEIYAYLNRDSRHIERL